MKIGVEEIGIAEIEVIEIEIVIEEIGIARGGEVDQKTGNAKEIGEIETEIGKTSDRVHNVFF